MKREELKIIDLLCDMGIDANGNRNLQSWKAYDIDEVNLVINTLEAENARLKNKVAAYEDERKCLSETITADADVIRRINKENSKLKCLAMLLAGEMYWFKSLCNKYEGSDWWVKMKRQSAYYRKAYRKAKQELMEVK